MPRRVLLFDGVCGLCDSLIQWLVQRDPAKLLHFAPLQGETAAAIRARHPELPSALETMAYVVSEGGEEKVYLRSEAAFRIAADLHLRFLAGLGILPRWLTDLGYRIVARFRYRIWGKLEVCRRPEPGDAERFLP